MKEGWMKKADLRGHNQLSSKRSQLGFSILVISWISRQDVSQLGQIGHSMTVLDAAHKGDSETPPTCLIWWSFGLDILDF